MPVPIPLPRDRIEPPRRVVAFLQNAWSPLYAGETWPRTSWLAALHASRSGKRLAVFAARCPDVVIHWDNVTPQVGPNPDSLLPPDLEHVRAVLETVNPDAVIAFGRSAVSAFADMTDRPVLLLPHPTYRVVTNRLFERAGRLVAAGWTGSVELRQDRGRVRRVACRD